VHNNNKKKTECWKTQKRTGAAEGRRIESNA